MKFWAKVFLGIVFFTLLSSPAYAYYNEKIPDSILPFLSISSELPPQDEDATDVYNLDFKLEYGAKAFERYKSDLLFTKVIVIVGETNNHQKAMKFFGEMLKDIGGDWDSMESFLKALKNQYPNAEIWIDKKSTLFNHPAKHFAYVYLNNIKTGTKIKPFDGASISYWYEGNYFKFVFIFNTYDDVDFRQDLLYPVLEKVEEIKVGKLVRETETLSESNEVNRIRYVIEGLALDLDNPTSVTKTEFRGMSKKDMEYYGKAWDEFFDDISKCPECSHIPPTLEKYTSTAQSWEDIMRYEEKLSVKYKSNALEKGTIKTIVKYLKKMKSAYETVNIVKGGLKHFKEFIEEKGMKNADEMTSSIASITEVYKVVNLQNAAKVTGAFLDSQGTAIDVFLDAMEPKEFSITHDTSMALLHGFMYAKASRLHELAIKMQLNPNEKTLNEYFECLKDYLSLKVVDAKLKTKYYENKVKKESVFQKVWDIFAKFFKSSKTFESKIAELREEIDVYETALKHAEDLEFTIKKEADIDE